MLFLLLHSGLVSTVWSVWWLRCDEMASHICTIFFQCVLGINDSAWWSGGGVEVIHLPFGPGYDGTASTTISQP